MKDYIKEHQNLFDKRWIDETSYNLLAVGHNAKNVANRYTYPYFENGSHRILGHTFYHRYNTNHIFMDSANENLTIQFIKAFEHYCDMNKRLMILWRIQTNCQFMGMDGSIHMDCDPGQEKMTTFLLMLTPDVHTEKTGGSFFLCPPNEEEIEVPFENGKFIEFKSNIPHRGNAFKEPNKVRYSLMFLASDA